MNGIIIDWDKLNRGGDVDLLSVHYAFLCVATQLEGDITVESLKLKNGDEDMVSEEGFREFLKVLVSVPWKEDELTEQQIGALNKIVEYLRYDYAQGEQPIQTGGITIEELQNSLSEG